MHFSPPSPREFCLLRTSEFRTKRGPYPGGKWIGKIRSGRRYCYDNRILEERGGNFSYKGESTPTSDRHINTHTKKYYNILYDIVYYMYISYMISYIDTHTHTHLSPPPSPAPEWKPLRFGRYPGQGWGSTRHPALCPLVVPQRRRFLCPTVGRGVKLKNLWNKTNNNNNKKKTNEISKIGKFMKKKTKKKEAQNQIYWLQHTRVESWEQQNNQSSV